MGSTKLLVATGVGVFLGTEEVISRMVFGSVPEGFDTVDLTSNDEKRLFGAAPPAVVAGTGVVSGIDVVLLLEFMAT